MGYMDLSVVGSDSAADALYEMEAAMARSLKKELKNPGNSYNTPGPVNVAMIFDEYIIGKFKDCYSGTPLHSLACDTSSAMKRLEMKWEKEDWEGDEANKKWHLDKFKKLIKRLDKFIEESD